MKYKARVARLRIEVSEVDIEITDEDGEQDRPGRGEITQLLAKRSAMSLPDEAWIDQSDRMATSYEPWVCFVMGEADVDPAFASSLEEAFTQSEPLGDISYMLLEADKQFGEARVILQPWFDSENMGYFELGALDEWIKQLQAQRNNEGAD